MTVRAPLHPGRRRHQQRPAAALQCPDPHGRLGKRTFLHLVNFSAARFNERIDPYYGAPRSIYATISSGSKARRGRWATSSNRRCTGPGQHPAGWPWPGQCPAHGRCPIPMSCWPCCATGFTRKARVAGELRGDGSPCSITRSPTTCVTACGAYRNMAQVQFAAGAAEVTPVHAMPAPLPAWNRPWP